MSKHKILIADNNKGFLAELASFLKSEQYLVTTAESLDQAKKVLDKKYDAVILDIRLRWDRDDKDISGLMLAETVARGTPVIILTGYPSVLKVRRALAPRRKGLSAAFDFVDKEEVDEKLLPVLKDAIFVRDLKRGIEAAWKQLWNEEAPSVIALCRRHGLSKDDALAVWPQIFAKLAKAPIFVLKKTALRKWLIDQAILQIGAYMTNQRVGLKASSCDPTGEILLNEQLLTEMAAAAVDGKVSREKLIQNITKAIESLGPQQEKVMMLYTFQGASKAKIAKQLGITEKTVSRHVRDGSRQLRKRISNLREG